MADISKVNDWTEGHWKTVMQALALPWDERYRDLVQKIILALESKNGTVASHTAKSPAILMKSESGYLTSLRPSKPNGLSGAIDATEDHIREKIRYLIEYANET